MGVLALWGLATALFFTSNHTAMISSVPDQHRGVATGAIYVIFGLGTTFGVSLGTLLLTAAFRYLQRRSDGDADADESRLFVQSMNFSFVIGGFMALRRCVVRRCAASAVFPPIELVRTESFVI